MPLQYKDAPEKCKCFQFYFSLNFCLVSKWVGDILKELHEYTQSFVKQFKSKVGEIGRGQAEFTINEILKSIIAFLDIKCRSVLECNKTISTWINSIFDFILYYLEKYLYSFIYTPIDIILGYVASGHNYFYCYFQECSKKIDCKITEAITDSKDEIENRTSVYTPNDELKETIIKNQSDYVKMDEF